MADLALSVVGLLGLVGTRLEVLNFDFTVKGRKKISVLSVLLDFQGFFLGRWAENVGIIPTPLHTHGGRHIPEGLYRLVEKNLERLMILFDESQNLVERYKEKSGLEPLVRLEARSTSVLRILERLHEDVAIRRPKSFR
ncbi:hypothetical protein G7Y89_g12850 [Cudoniella acicularis]|uniref:Prion-inhibition and propagation HeLo domain-containing protein n=1 Tax=Cudoniella acicularis TaxID=354080 RepID=A0A8H4VWZ3_9HELO|nr:hypothetical protein G7Y89_g12850 [Cudoniella acicularis]